jgi:hypothetical protein
MTTHAMASPSTAARITCHGFEKPSSSADSAPPRGPADEEAYSGYSGHLNTNQVAA